MPITFFGLYLAACKVKAPCPQPKSKIVLSLKSGRSPNLDQK